MKADYAARLTVLLSFSLLLLATPSYADSDGCYSPPESVYRSSYNKTR